MKKFLSFLREEERKVKEVITLDLDDWFSEEQPITEALSSNDKGVLHELLVGQEINRMTKHGKEHDHHMSPEAKRVHDQIVQRSGATKEELANHVKLAKGTAEHFFKHFGKDIHSAHWSSKPGDIERITGHAESQQQNSADIILRHKNGAHIGLSLKITQKKGGKVPVGNPGAKQTDGHLGTNAVQHYDKAREELVKKHPELKGKSMRDMKQHIKDNDHVRATALKLSNEAIGKIRDEWHHSLSSMHPQKLSDHIRNNLLHAHETKVPLYKATTGGHGDDHGVHVEHSATAHDHILKDHKNITVHKSGNNSIEFKHKGKTFLRHRLKPESTPIATSLKGSAE